MDHVMLALIEKLAFLQVQIPQQWPGKLSNSVGHVVHRTVVEEYYLRYKIKQKKFQKITSNMMRLIIKCMAISWLHGLQRILRNKHQLLRFM